MDSEPIQVDIECADSSGDEYVPDSDISSESGNEDKGIRRLLIH